MGGKISGMPTLVGRDLDAEHQTSAGRIHLPAIKGDLSLAEVCNKVKLSRQYVPY